MMLPFAGCSYLPVAYPLVYIESLYSQGIVTAYSEGHEGSRVRASQPVHRYDSLQSRPRVHAREHLPQLWLEGARGPRLSSLSCAPQPWSDLTRR